MLTSLFLSICFLLLPSETVEIFVERLSDLGQSYPQYLPVCTENLIRVDAVIETPVLRHQLIIEA
jgi:hypothetical protein